MRSTLALSCAPLLAILAPLRLWASADFGVKLLCGPEYDTNATREVAAEQQPDGLLRFFLHAPFRWSATDSDRLRLDYYAGAKAFLHERTEDTMLNRGQAEYTHFYSKRLQLGLSAEAKHRLLRVNDRGYLFSTARGFLLRSFGLFTVKGWAGGRYFLFPAARYFTYSEPLGGVQAALSKDRFTPFVQYEFSFRSFNNPAGQGGELAWKSFAQGGFCSHNNRADIIHTAGAGVALEAPLRCTITYGLLYTGSDCERWSSLKHRLSLLLAARPWPSTFVHLSAAIQKASYFEGVPYDLDIGDEDENQNSLSVRIVRRLSEMFSIELNYAFYANEFRRSGYSFSRHTFFAGPSVKF